MIDKVTYRGSTAAYEKRVLGWHTSCSASPQIINRVFIVCLELAAPPTAGKQQGGPKGKSSSKWINTWTRKISHQLQLVSVENLKPSQSWSKYCESYLYGHMAWMHTSQEFGMHYFFSVISKLHDCCSFLYHFALLFLVWEAMASLVRWQFSTLNSTTLGLLYKTRYSHSASHRLGQSDINCCTLD